MSRNAKLNLLTVGFIAVCAIGVIVLMGEFVRRGQPSVATVLPTPTTMSAPMQAALGQLAKQARAGEAGTSGKLTSTNHLWVNRIGLEAYNRAESDRDDKGKSRISDAYEHFFPTAGTQVLIVVKDGDIRQLEILDGPYRGRRGWSDASASWYDTQ